MRTSSARKRIAGRKLQRARARLISKSPLCVSCESRGIPRLGTQRDHIVALMNGGEDVESNTQMLCDECHLTKTLVDKGFRPKPFIGRDGWPETMAQPIVAGLMRGEG